MLVTTLIHANHVQCCLSSKKKSRNPISMFLLLPNLLPYPPVVLNQPHCPPPGVPPLPGPGLKFPPFCCPCCAFHAGNIFCNRTYISGSCEGPVVGTPIKGGQGMFGWLGLVERSATLAR